MRGLKSLMNPFAKIFWLVSCLALLCIDESRAAVGGVIGGTPIGITARTLYANNGANLYALKTAATAGATIVVGPGLYTVGVTNLLKDQVNWFFYPGAVVSNFNGGLNFGGIFVNGQYGTVGPMTCTVAGYGTFIQVGGGDELDIAGMINVSNAASVISIQAQRLLISGDSSTFYAAAVWDAASFTLEVHEEINGSYGLNELAGVSLSGGLWWKNGRGIMTCPRVFTGNASALYALGDGSADYDLTFERIHSTNASAVWLELTHAENKCWLSAKEIIGGSNFLSRGTAVSITGGKLYLNAQKLSSFSNIGLPVIKQTGGSSWLTAQKVTTTNVSHWFEQTGGFSDVSVLEWEDNGGGVNARPYNFLISGGTNYMRSGRALSRWGPGLKLTGGQAEWSGMKLDTFSTLQGSNVCLWITGGTPVLGNCTFIPGSLFSVSNASAGDLRVYGTGGLRAKSNITATLTVRVGTVTVDGTYVDR